MRSSELYEILKDIPKGVLHHDHFDCNEDEDFVLFYLYSIDNTLSLIQIFTFQLIKKPLKLDQKNKHKMRVG